MHIFAGEGVKDLYDSERKAVRDIAYALRIRHAFREMKNEQEAMRAFDVEARNRCAEIGLLIEVEWEWTNTDDTGRVIDQSPDVADDPVDNNLYWKPRIVITGRTDKLSEYDHDQQKWEIRKGVLDGIEGVIDPRTGQLGEAKKKDIF